MKKIVYSLAVIFLFLACKSSKKASENQIDQTPPQESNNTVVIAFGSCNKHDENNVFWDDIIEENPDVFIWGGDNIYADTEDMGEMKRMYLEQKTVPEYAELSKKVFITGTWDDHDYGVNDGGVEFYKKKESQQLFLDFMEVDEKDPRRIREGVYSTQTIKKESGLVKLINLDTRYFRTPLTDGRKQGKRYVSNGYGEGTILGAAQWEWLEKELSNSKADFNIIVSSIQFLSSEHGFEKWANHPHEVEKMLTLIKNSKAEGVIFLSGDRHISEFSKMRIDEVSYPLVDFTSSGLTHSYTSFKEEPNKYRIGDVISTTSYGIVEIDLETKAVDFKIMGDEGQVYQNLKQDY